MAARQELLAAVAQFYTVARIGGDEFALLLLEVVERGQADAVARKIVAALAEPFELGRTSRAVEVGTSIGIAIFPADAPDADSLLRAADTAMYDAKQAGNSLRCAA